MKKIILIFIIIILAVVGVVLAMSRPKTTTYQQSSDSSINQASNSPMKIESSAFGQDQNIPAQYTCDGQASHPALQFRDVPQNAQSLALVVDDPDAPSGDWVHWLVWNISPSTTQIPEGSVPNEATEGTTSFGQTGWGAPCPPSGSPHHYRFKLYALDTKLSLPTRTTKEDLEQAMNGHVVSNAELVGVYGRK